MTCVLITGATGVVGSAVAQTLLSAGHSLALVIRAESDMHLEQRAKEVFAWLRIAGETQPSFIRLLRGDIEQPLFGMTAADYDALAGQATHVVHAAGRVKLNDRLETARNASVGATRNILAFCKQAEKKGALEKLEYLSTVGVAGAAAGVVPEARIMAVRRYRNSYEQAKGEAEELVWRAIAEGLPATVHRPSMVIGAAADGRVLRFQVFYHLLEFLSGSRTNGWIPVLGEAVLDVIPCDVLAQFITACLKDKSTVGKVYHIASGDNAVPLAALAQAARELIRQEGDAPLHRHLPPWMFRALLPLFILAAPPNHRRALAGLPYFLRYLKEPQIFDNCVFAAALSSKGLSLPRFSDYSARVFEYYLHHRPQKGHKHAPLKQHR